MRSDYFLEYNSFGEISFGEKGQEQGYSLRIFQDGLAYLVLLENSEQYLSAPFEEVLQTRLYLDETQYRSIIAQLENANILQLPEVLPADPRVAMRCRTSRRVSPVETEPASFTQTFGNEAADTISTSADSGAPGGRLLAAAENPAATESKSVRISYYAENGFMVNRVSAQTGCSAEVYPEGFINLYQFMEGMIRELRAQKNVERGQPEPVEEPPRPAQTETEAAPEPQQETPEETAPESEAEQETEPQPGEESAPEEETESGEESESEEEEKPESEEESEEEETQPEEEENTETEEEEEPEAEPAMRGF